MKNIKKIFNAIYSCFTKGHKLYRIIALICLIVRVILIPILLPKAFEPAVTFFVSKLHLPYWLYLVLSTLILSLLDSIILSRLFHLMTFVTVGNFYTSRTAPGFGSAAYCIFYFFYNAILVVIFYQLIWWLNIIMAGFYILLSVLFYLIGYLLGALPRNFKLRLIIHVIITAVVYTGVILLSAWLQHAI